MEKTQSIKNPELVNQNLRLLVKTIGGADSFLNKVKGTRTSKPALYSYIKSTSTIKPNDHLVRAVSEYFNVPIDQLYKQNLRKAGWRYIPSRLPVLNENFIDGKQGYTYRAFQVIELLQQRHLLPSLQSFVDSLDEYRDKYTTFANMRQGIQKITMDIVQDIKKTYPEVNTNFIFDGKLPAILEQPERSTRNLKREIMQMVEEKLKAS